MMSFATNIAREARPIYIRIDKAKVTHIFDTWYTLGDILVKVGIKKK